MRYLFEYVFVPKILTNSQGGDFNLESVSMFDDFDMVEYSFSENFPEEAEDFDWEDFSICKEIHKDYTYWLLRFPKPQNAPEAKWGIIIDKDDQPLRYFTFEKTIDGRFALCSPCDGKHSFYDFYEKDTTVEKFISASLMIVEGEEED